MDLLIVKASKPQKDASKAAAAVAPSRTDSKGAPPIIIVPAALTSLLTVFNVKSFLEAGQFLPTEEARKQVNGVKPSTVVLDHANAKNASSKVTFQVVDGVERLKDTDWDRVVAVFVSGQAWQFRGWKWTDPVEIFSNVKGFYLKYADVKTDPQIKQWNVTVLEVNRYKRHLDAQCVYEFWSIVDRYLAAQKPHLLNK